MFREYNRKLVLEDGQEYYGYSFGSPEDKVCEVVFNTSMVGYQEILSDPSYTYQAVVMTYPLIGNYGMAEDDYETHTPTLGAFIVREYNDEPSNFRSAATLGDVILNGNWDAYSGKVANLGLVSGEDPTANFVQIPMESTQWADGFTQDNYKELVAKMFAGEITVSNAIDAQPATEITVNVYDNIKG